MEYITLITFLEIIIRILSSIIIFRNCLKILITKHLLRKVQVFSPIITVYFIYFLISSIFSLIAEIYLAIFWRPNENIYDARIFFITSAIPWTLMFNWAILEFLLGVERSFSVIFPTKYKKQYKMRYAYFSVILICGTLIFIILFNAIYIIPTTPSTKCQYFACLLSPQSQQNSSSLKLYFALPNVANGIILYLVIRKTLSNFSVATSTINKTISYLIIATTLLDLCPPFVNDLFVKITGAPLRNYLGPWGTVLSAVCCSITTSLYYRMFRKFKVENVVIVQVSRTL